MATKESLAIREEAAQERIKRATELLAAQTGTTIPPIVLTEKNPFARNAELAEKVADALESMVKIVAPDIELDAQDGEGSDGGDNTSGRGSEFAQPTQEPIKRSTANRKR